MFEKLKSRWEKDRQEKIRNAEKRLEHMKILFPVFKKYGIKVAYIFGSTINKSCNEFPFKMFVLL